MEIPERNKAALPPIPAKLYFSIGEAADLCGVKAHVLRYWEQEFPVLSPVKRRGNRRYYREADILLARQIRDLLYNQGFTIQGARDRLQADSLSQGTQSARMPDLAAVRRQLQEILDLCRS
ncbi:MerR family transcriptional regulator [Thermithiobacillus plumbiphilus]|uniref:MerR family transcriptional regulator n=1 Tax=Thermithiobacillus plumbiphilus TaxID=1729899 RepID=A0ABU9DC45_9PROT